MYWLPYSSHTFHHPSQTPCFPWISYATQKLMLDSCKMLQKQSEAFHTFLWHHFFSSLKQNFITYRSFKVSDCIFEIHQLWQSGFSRMYSNCYCSCSFEPEIIEIGQSSHKMYINNILNFQESTTMLNAHTKKVWKLIVCILYIGFVSEWFVGKYLGAGSNIRSVFKLCKTKILKGQYHEWETLSISSRIWTRVNMSIS